MFPNNFLEELDNLKSEEDKINFIKSIKTSGSEESKQIIHKLKSVLFIIANTHITGDPRDPQFIKMQNLIGMAGEAIIELESLGL